MSGWLAGLGNLPARRDERKERREEEASFFIRSACPYATLRAVSEDRRTTHSSTILVRPISSHLPYLSYPAPPIPYRTIDLGLDISTYLSTTCHNRRYHDSFSVQLAKSSIASIGGMGACPHEKSYEGAGILTLREIEWGVVVSGLCWRVDRWMVFVVGYLVGMYGK